MKQSYMIGRPWCHDNQISHQIILPYYFSSKIKSKIKKINIKIQRGPHSIANPLYQWSDPFSHATRIMRFPPKYTRFFYTRPHQITPQLPYNLARTRNWAENRQNIATRLHALTYTRFMRLFFVDQRIRSAPHTPSIVRSGSINHHVSRSERSPPSRLWRKEPDLFNQG